LKTVCTIFVMAALSTYAAAQDARVSPLPTAKDNVHLLFTRPSGETAAGRDSFHTPYPPFCVPGNCLYYAGDFDSTDSDANGLFNSNDTGADLEGQVWVGVKPNRDVIVTGATFNQFFTSGYALTNPVPFVVQVGIKPRQPGKTICSTSGNGTLTVYGEGDGGPEQYSVTVAKFSKSCRLERDKVYYVNLLPTSSNGYGFVTNVEDKKPKNHYGWKNDLDDCYFNGAAFGADYVTCNSQGAFDELSIALTGKKTK
jgi:hypothetical protein